MRNPLTLTNLVLSLGVALALPIGAHADVIFSDSFENDSTSMGVNYGLPDSSSNPSYTAVFTGVINTTPTDTNYNKPNGGPVAIIDTGASTSPSDHYLNGQDGSNYVSLTNSGGSGDNDGPPFTDRTPSDQTDSIKTINGAAGSPGIFTANTTYSLTALMAHQYDPTEEGTYALLDGTTGIVLASFTYDFSNATDTDFHSFAPVVFDTATDPSIAINGDFIQIELTAFQSSAQPFNRSVNFDDVLLTATADTPEPASWALMFGGLAALVGLRVRSARRA